MFGPLDAEPEPLGAGFVEGGVARVAAVLGCVLVLGAGAARANPCEMRGTPRHAVIEVRPRGEPAMRVELAGVPLVARFARRDGVATVESTGPLRFRGNAVELPLALEREVVTAGGRLRLSPAAHVMRARPHEAGLRLDVRIAPRTSTAVRLPSVAVACEAVRVGDEASPAVRPTSPATWLARRRALAMRARPGAATGLRIEMSAARAVPLEQLARSGAWVRVRAAWSDGSAVEGWVERDLLEFQHWGAFGYGSFGGAPIVGCASAPLVAGPGGYAGPATLRRGGALSAAPGRGRWAEALEDVPIEVEVEDETAPWVRVIRIAGIAETCDRLDHAWVPREEVAFPAP